MSQYRFTLNTIEWELEHIINLSLITPSLILSEKCDKCSDRKSKNLTSPCKLIFIKPKSLQ